MPWQVDERGFLQQVMALTRLPLIQMRVMRKPGQQFSFAFLTVGCEEDQEALVTHLHLASVQGHCVTCQKAEPPGWAPSWVKAQGKVNANPKLVPPPKKAKPPPETPAPACQAPAPAEGHQAPAPQAPAPVSPTLVPTSPTSDAGLESEPTRIPTEVATSTVEEDNTAASWLKMEHLGTCEGRGLQDTLFHGCEVLAIEGGLAYSRPRTCACCDLVCPLCKAVLSPASQSEW